VEHKGQEGGTAPGKASGRGGINPSLGDLYKSLSLSESHHLSKEKVGQLAYSALLCPSIV
jgi:hypothetical protein